MLKGKVFLITGATGSIGKSATLALAKAGARLIILAKNEDKLKDLSGHLIKRAEFEPLCCPLDFLTLTASDATDFFKELHQFTHQLDGLIHAAGIPAPMTPIENLSHKDIQNVWQINFHAKLMLTQKAIPLLKNSEDGKIVFCQPKKSSLYQSLENMIHLATQSLANDLNEELAQNNIKATCLKLPAINSPYRQKGYPYEARENNIDAHLLADIWPKLLSQEELTIDKVLSTLKKNERLDA